eukprot:SAG22_NODE_214_length_15003_cov_18.466519_7_plen_130_part_00
MTIAGAAYSTFAHHLVYLHVCSGSGDVINGEGGWKVEPFCGPGHAGQRQLGQVLEVAQRGSHRGRLMFPGHLWPGSACEPARCMYLSERDLRVLGVEQHLRGCGRNRVGGVTRSDGGGACVAFACGYRV